MAGNVRIYVEWGYEGHSLLLSLSDWQRAQAGEVLACEGGGYWHEGEFYRDFWEFRSGELKVSYQLGDDPITRGDGFHGSFEELDVEFDEK